MEHYNYVLPTREGKTATALIIKSIEEVEIKIRRNINNSWPLVEENNGTSINKIINRMGRQKERIKERCNAIQLKYVEQCTNYDNTEAINWGNLAQTTMKTTRGREPAWFKEMIKHIKEIYIQGNKKLITPNPWISRERPTKSSWMVMSSANINFIGKITSIKGEVATVKHWKEKRQNNQLVRCNGCYQNDPSLDSKTCAKKININRMWEIKVDCKKKLRIGATDLEKLRRTNRIKEKITLHKISEKNDIKIMRTKEDNKALEEIRSKIWGKKEVTVNLQFRNEERQGIIKKGIICQIEQTNTQWEIFSQEWPSKEKHFVAAIIQIAALGKKRIRIKIRKGQNICKKATNIQNIALYKTHEIQDIHNWPGWMSWKAICTQNSAQFEFIPNSEAEIIANQERYKISGEIQYENIRQDTFVTVWKDRIVMHKTRRFIRHIYNAKGIAKWQSQIRTQIWEEKKTDTDWETFFEYLNYKCKPTTRETNPKMSSLKAFKIKMLLEELPTNEVLSNRGDKTIVGPWCPQQCGKTESNYHMMVCDKNKISLRKTIKEATSKILEDKGISSMNALNNIIHTITKSFCITDEATGLTRITHGMLEQKEVKEINKLVTEKDQKESLAVIILHKITEEIQERIWKPRNQEAAQRKQGNQNKNREKRRKEEEIRTVAEDISKNHCPNMVDRNTAEKVQRWGNMFVQFNCTPNIINHFKS